MAEGEEHTTTATSGSDTRTRSDAHTSIGNEQGGEGEGATHTQGHENETGEGNSTEMAGVSKKTREKSGGTGGRRPRNPYVFKTFSLLPHPPKPPSLKTPQQQHQPETNQQPVYDALPHDGPPLTTFPLPPTFYPPFPYIFPAPPPPPPPPTSNLRPKISGPALRTDPPPPEATTPAGIDGSTSQPPTPSLSILRNFVGQRLEAKKVAEEEEQKTHLAAIVKRPGKKPQAKTNKEGGKEMLFVPTYVGPKGLLEGEAHSAGVLKKPPNPPTNMPPVANASKPRQNPSANENEAADVLRFGLGESRKRDHPTGEQGREGDRGAGVEDVSTDNEDGKEAVIMPRRKRRMCEHGVYRSKCHSPHVCPHNNLDTLCRECQPKFFCEHGKAIRGCEICRPGVRKCAHGNRKKACAECAATKGMCEHGIKKKSCRTCSPERWCEHNRFRASCVPCGGSKICEHDKLRGKCPTCSPQHFCVHLRQKHLCRECGGSVFCVHGRQRATCRPCGGSMYCQHLRAKNTCKECHPNGLPEKRSRAKRKSTASDADDPTTKRGSRLRSDSEGVTSDAARPVNATRPAAARGTSAELGPLPPLTTNNNVSSSTAKTKTTTTTSTGTGNALAQPPTRTTTAGFTSAAAAAATATATAEPKTRSGIKVVFGTAKSTNTAPKTIVRPRGWVDTRVGVVAGVGRGQGGVQGGDRTESAGLSEDARRAAMALMELDGMAEGGAKTNAEGREKTAEEKVITRSFERETGVMGGKVGGNAANVGSDGSDREGDGEDGGEGDGMFEGGLEGEMGGDGGEGGEDEESGGEEEGEGTPAHAHASAPVPVPVHATEVQKKKKGTHTIPDEEVINLLALSLLDIDPSGVPRIIVNFPPGTTKVVMAGARRRMIAHITRAMELEAQAKKKGGMKK